MLEFQASYLSGTVALKLEVVLGATVCDLGAGGALKVHTSGPEFRISDEAILRSEQASA